MTLSPALISQIGVACATFLLLWWCILLVLLPCGITVPTTTQLGCADSAPEHPRIRMKMLLAAGIALVITAIVMLAIHKGWLDLYYLFQAIE